MSGDVRLKPISLAVSHELYDKLVSVAKKKKMARRAVIRRAIVLYIEREDSSSFG